MNPTRNEKAERKIDAERKLKRISRIERIGNSF
jgi:hypothetical protein